MYLSAHVPLAILVGSTTGNPAIAFGLGALSHFALDAIPHDTHEDLHGAVLSSEQRKKTFIKEVAIDMIVWIAMIVFFFAYFQPENWVVLSLALAGGLLPDLITGVYIFLPWKWAKQIALPITRLNHLAHMPLGKHAHINMFASRAIQLFAIIAFSALVLRTYY